MSLIFKQIFLKQILFLISFVYLLILVPILIVVYSSVWYDFNYNSQEITSKISLSVRDNATLNLIGFFMNREDLNELWNEKEKIHMNDVKQIYLSMILFGIFCLIYFTLFFDKVLLLKNLKYCTFFVFSLLIILPFFSLLFGSIFHFILFSNNYWIIDSGDISYYLFPIEFFINSFLFIIFFSLLEIFIFYFILKEFSK